MVDVVADIGNSRIKVARASETGEIMTPIAFPLSDATAWTSALRTQDWLQPESRWTIASVNPPAASKLAEVLSGQPRRWLHSARDVPTPHVLARPEKTGADRALAVRAARSEFPDKGPLIIVMCGTAITVEYVDQHGVWQGGAIAAGLMPIARALNRDTAQLPELRITDEPVPPLSDETHGALAAGLYWGLVGAVRELVSQQSHAAAPHKPLIIWGGGDAHWLAAAIGGPTAIVEPYLVLKGIAELRWPDDLSP